MLHLLSWQRWPVTVISKLWITLFYEKMENNNWHLKSKQQDVCDTHSNICLQAQTVTKKEAVVGNACIEL